VRRTARRLALVAVLVLAAGTGIVVGRVDGAAVRAHLPGTPAPTASPDPTRPPLLGRLPDAPPPTAVGLAATLAPVLADPALGGEVSASVVDAQTGTSLLDRRGSTPGVPASTTKIVTAVAVLAGLDPATRLQTRAVAGPGPGDVVLVGGGDVTLAGPRAPPAEPASARLADLAAQVTAARAGAPVARVLVDDTAYSGPTTGPGWKPGYVTGGDVAPVGALSVDGGRRTPGRDDRVPDPALAAGAAFAALLGVPAAPVLRGPAPAGATVLGTVASPLVAQLVEQMLTRSDNDLAETLVRRLALERGEPATFDGGAAAVRAQLAGILPGGALPAGSVLVGGSVLVDGSGLSREDRLQPAAVAGLLSAVVRDGTGRLAPVLTGLPVAGFDGTLEKRFRTGPSAGAAGQLRAKTGTLLGVSALAGLVRTAEGRLLAFDITLSAVPTAPGGSARAEAALDRLAAALASCGCR